SKALRICVQPACKSCATCSWSRIRSNCVFTASGVVVTWLSASAVAKILMRSVSMRCPRTKDRIQAASLNAPLSGEGTRPTGHSRELIAHLCHRQRSWWFGLRGLDRSGAHDDTPAQRCSDVSDAALKKRKNATHNDMRSGTTWSYQHCVAARLRGSHRVPVDFVPLRIAAGITAPD